jgi:hypothetical protein
MGKVCEKHPELHGQRDAYRHCVLCTKERGAAWQKLNREHVAAKTKKWRDASEENRIKAIAATRAWHKANPHYNKVKLHARRARLVGAGGKLSGGLFDNLMRLQREKCACCGVSFSQVKPNMDHIIPLSGGGTNTDMNMQLLCEKCNRSKKAKHPIAFMQEKGFLI